MANNESVNLIERELLRKQLLEKTYPKDDTFEILCRDKEKAVLRNLLGKDREPLPSCISINGMKGTGKSIVTTAVCAELGIKICRSFCSEMYSPGIVFETLINQMSDFIPSKMNNYSSEISIPNMLEFIRNAKRIIQNSSERFCIVLENAEKLGSNISIFSSFSRMQELCESDRICVIFISRLPVEKYFENNSFIEPITIHFPEYTLDELKEILVACRLYHGMSEGPYSYYVNYLISTFCVATKDLQELMHMADIIFPAYCEPIINDEADEDDVVILARNIKPKLRMAMSSVYVKELSGKQFLKKQKLIDNSVNSSSITKSSNILQLELPFYSKFMLTAAYLASHNPKSTDKRFFMKHHGKSRKSKASIKAQLKFASEMVGPKPFPRVRLLAIFYAITDEKEGKIQPSVEFLSVISSLVTLGLLSAIGTEYNIDSPKYKCNISLENIREICRTIDFDITRHLYAYAC